MTRKKTISAVFTAVLVVLAGGAAVTLATTSTDGTGLNAAIQDETTTVAANETTVAVNETTTVAVNETTTAEPVETETEVEETPGEAGAQESFNVSNLSAPVTANLNETITVNATITNPNDQEATQPVEFRLDGDLVERQNVTLGAGESQNVSFQVDTTGVAPGLHIHGIQTRDFGEVAQITILDVAETTTEAVETTTAAVNETTTAAVNETTTEEEVVETTTEAVNETTTEEEVVETTTEEEVVNETTTEEEVVETTTEEEVVNETTTEEEVVETTTEEEVVNETTTEEEVVETTTEEEVETTTEEEVVETTTEEPERVEQVVFKVEQLQIDEWSFVIGDELEPDRTEVVEDVEIRDRTQHINLTALLMEDGTVEDAMVNETAGETITTPTTPEGGVPEDIETVRVILRDITIENVTFIIELPSRAELRELPETPVIEETPTEVEETTTEVEETPTEVEETTTEVEETPTEVEETTTEVEETTTEVEETTTEVEETTTEVVETTTEEETPTEVEETTTEVEETPTEVEETTTEVVETTTEVVETTTEVEETTTEVVETTTEEVIGPGALSFNVSNLSAPETAEIGETVTVTANVTNPNDQEARQEVEFRIDGDLVERQNVTLDAGESQNVSFEVDTTGLEAGTYIHGVLTDEFGELALITLEEPAEETTTVEETPTEEETTTEVVETTTVEETPTEGETPTEEETTTEAAETTTEEEGGETTTEAG